MRILFYYIMNVQIINTILPSLKEEFSKKRNGKAPFRYENQGSVTETGELF